MMMVIRGRGHMDKPHAGDKPISLDALRSTFSWTPTAGIFLKGNRDAYIGERGRVRVMGMAWLRFNIKFQPEGEVIMRQCKETRMLLPEFLIEEKKDRVITDCTLIGWNLLPEGKLTEFTQ